MEKKRPNLESSLIISTYKTALVTNFQHLTLCKIVQMP